MSFDSDYELIFSLVNSIPEDPSVNWRIENEIDSKLVRPIFVTNCLRSCNDVI
jgi:hypothetical protein